MFLYTQQTAIRYQEFSVVKLNNKFGVRQERAMGIDDQYITNAIPENKVSKTNDKVKRGKRALSEVQKVWQNAKTTEFFIKYKDQTYRYESNQAEEIVAKITFLLKMIEERNQKGEEH